ncbi:acetyl-CoA carboxylase biotin carboxyl carrier protein [Armatimonas sp.]|uniref:acetyl-CoA carboxylase biotin carboxyl carrier protein n=1 Tax=Armatimonas sp. TaxID=1872638 RepID=UPI003753A646
MNHEQIEGFAALFSAVPRLTEIEVRSDGVSLRLRRSAPPLPVALVATEMAPRATIPPVPFSSLVVTAEHVGVVQLAPVTVGERVKAGQVLAQIDTMRLLSACKAPVAGKLVSLLVEEGQPVEYGQPLFEIMPEEK